MKIKKLTQYIGVIGLLGVLLTPNIVVIAQENREPGNNILDIPGSATLSESGVKKGELANCFDVYKFGSIGLTIGSKKSTYEPFDTVFMQGDIINNNAYPVTDITVRARILKNIPNPVERRAKDITLDDIVISEGITLKPNERYNIEKMYLIPGNAPSGEYTIQYYVYNQNRFNLSGLSFTEDVIANRTQFTVKGKSEHIYLDKTNITVDGKEHNTRGFITKQDKNKPIPIKIPLINPENTEKEMEISYKVYKWDETLPEQLLKESINIVKVAANGKIDLEYIVESGEYPVYYVVITAKGVGEAPTDAVREQTMAHIRFAVNGNNRPRINWVGLTKYPLEPGEEAKIMTCVHNTNDSTDEGPIKVQSIVKNKFGKELTSLAYEGQMVSSISGLMNTFKANKGLDVITIETTLSDAKGNIVDTINTVYDCNKINPELCIGDTQNRFLSIGIIVILILGVISFGIIKRKKSKKNSK